MAKIDPTVGKKIENTEGMEITIGTPHIDKTTRWILPQLPTDVINTIGKLHYDAEEQEDSDKINAADIDKLITQQMVETIGMPRGQLIEALQNMDWDDFDTELLERGE